MGQTLLDSARTSCEPRAALVLVAQSNALSVFNMLNEQDRQVCLALVAIEEEPAK